MTVKHTPGPWSSDGSGNITHQDKQPIAFVNWTAYGEGKANARLIAAAPDLLDALQGIIGYFDSGNNVPVSQATIKARSDEVKSARAAIAKATGGSA